MKKIAIFIAVLMALGIFPGAVAAEDDNLVLNPGFDENWREDSSGEYWKTSDWSATYREGATQSTDIYFTAPNALAATPLEGKSVTASQYIETVVPLETYRLSFYYRTDSPETASQNVGVQLYFYDNKTNRNSVASSRTFYLEEAEKNKWVKFSVDFEMPAGGYCLWMSIMVNYPAKGYIDDVKLVQLENLVANPSFDAGGWNGVRPPKWEGTNTNGIVGKSTDVFQSAPNALAVTPTEEKSVAANQYINTVLPLATYRLSFYYYTDAPENVDQNVGVKLYFYNNIDERQNIASNRNYYLQEEAVEKDKWTKFSVDFEMPEGGYCLWMSIMVNYPAKGYIDDVKLVKIADPKAGTMKMDNIFYYAEEIDANSMGEAVVTLNPDHTIGREVSGYGAMVALMDGNTELFKSSERISFTEGKALLRFPLSEMVQKKRYTVRTEIYYQEDLVWTGEASIYIYPRPLNIDETGNYRRQVFTANPNSASGYAPVMQNGQYVFENEPFLPTIVYHPGRPTVNMPDEENPYLLAKKAGVNVVQIGRYYATPERIKNELDLCAQYGLMALIPLNQDSRVAAGNATYAENTEKVVEIAKNHPATFAYSPIDEPFSHMTDSMISDLENSYIIIRNVDAVHPVFITDNNNNYGDEHAHYSDIMSIDPYPRSAEKSANYVWERTKEAKQAAGKKPVYAILQAFPYGTVGDGPMEGIGAYTPTGAQYLHMWYQAMASGAKGMGFYELANGSLDYKLYETPALSELWNTMTSFSSKELSKAFTFFQNSSVIETIENTDCIIQLRYFGSQTYAVVLSKSHTEVESTSLDIGCEGKIVELYAGTADNAVTINGDIWSMRLAPSTASIYSLQTEGIIVSRESTVVQRAEKGQTYTAEVTAVPTFSGKATLFVAVYQTQGKARKLLQLIPLEEKAVTAGEESYLSGTFSVPTSLGGVNEISVYALSCETLQSLTDAVDLPVS